MLELMYNPLELSKLAIASLLIICFFQSGVDKIVDRGGNLAWLNEHFSSTILKNYVSLLVTIITILEIITACILLFGVYVLLSGAYHGIPNPGESVIYLGFLMSLITLLCLFVGQRLAKDYVGAYVIVVYFALTIVGVLCHNGTQNYL